MDTHRCRQLMSLQPLINSPALVREWFFTPDTPPEIVDACRRRPQDESYPALLDTSPRTTAPATRAGARARPGRRSGRVLHHREVHRTARAYRTEAEVFPSMGHDWMLDVGRQAVADRIDTWIPETAR